jgi:hypothetical protein
MPYLNRITNLKFGGAVFTGTTDELNTVSGVVPGIVSSGSALVVNSVNDLTGVNIMTATGYYGSVLTASQPAITTVGTLNGLNVNGTTTTNILTATSINGTLLTASQPNITTIGSLTGLTLTGALQSQYSSFGNDGLDIGLMGRFQNNFINGAAYIELNNQAGAKMRIGCDGNGLLNTLDTAHVAIGNYSNGDLKLYTNSNEKIRIKAGGNIGINTTSPNKILSINSSTGECMRLIYNNAIGTETIYTDLTMNASGECIITPTGVISYIKSNLVIGNNSSGPNVLYFNGVTDDPGINVTVIAERIYGSSEKTELLLFKGTDFNNTTGPDRIRLRAAEHRFQTYTSIEDFSTLSDNNDRLVIVNSGLIGIGTTVPNRQLSINNITGNCLRIIFNNSTGTETIFSDILIDSNGNLNLIPTGSYIYTTKIYRIQTSSGDGFSHLSPNGLIELMTRVSNSTTQIGTNTNTELNFMTNNTNRMVINTSGNVGIGTSVPNRQLSINNTSGNCLRLIFNNSTGTGTIFTDFNVTATGNLSINPSGNYITTTGKRIEIINNGYGFSHLSGTGVEVVSFTSGNSYGFLGTFSTHPLYLGTDNTHRIVIDSAGLVGINTNTPTYRLQINTLINRYGMVHTDGTTSIGTYIGGISSDAQIGTLSAHSLSLFANGGSVRAILSTSGNFGVNTLVPNLKVSINSSTGSCLRLIYNNSTGTETTFSDLTLSAIGDLNITPTGVYTYIKSNLIVGRNNTGPNMIQFNGTTDDDQYTTLITERIYANPQSSELLIFKGDDINITNGPDRVRFRSGEFRFQTIVNAGEKGASGTIGNILDNNNKLVILNSGLIGINTTVPNKQLTINSDSGDCLRLIYNNGSGGELYYGDINISPSGKILFTSTGYSTGFEFIGGTITGTLASGPQPNITQIGTLTNLTISGILTAGTFNTTNLGGIITTPDQPNITSLGQYLLLGTSTDSGRMISALKSSITNGTTLSTTLGKFNSTLNQSVYSYTHIADGSTSNYISIGFTNQPVMNIFGDNRIGINTLVPSKQLTINSTTGQNLRLVYNNTTGTEVTYTDYLISSVGGVTFQAVGSIPSFTFIGGNVTATLANGPQPNITQVGTLSSLTVTNNISASTVSATSVSGVLTTSSQPNITSIGTLTNLNVSGTLVVGTFSAGAVASVIQTPGQPNITSLGTLVELNLSGPINGATIVTANSYNGVINTASQPNITSVGTLSSLNVAGPITGVTTFSATTLTGTISTASQPNITSIGALSSLNVTGKLSINTTSVAEQVNINSSTGEVLRLIFNNNVGTESNYVDLNVSSTGRLLLTSVGTNPGFTFIGGNVTAVIQTPAQPNITSLGTLTSLNVSGTISAGSMTVASLGGTLTTASQPNITSLGTLTGLTLSGAISGVTTLTATNLAGTITTASQPNITALGTLTSLRVGTGVVSVNTTSTGRQVNINSTTGQCLRLINNNSTGTETVYSDITVSSTGTVTFLAVGSIPNYSFTGGNVAATISTAAQPNITSLGTLTSLTLSGPITGVTTLTATDLAGTITTVAQPNITSLGILNSLNLSGQISSAYSSATGKLMYLNNTNVGTSSYMEINNQTGTRALFGADGSSLANGAVTSVVMGNFSNGALKLYTNSQERMHILSTGMVGINTSVPADRLTINSGGAGDCMRLIFNNSTGTELFFIDYATDSTGNSYIKPSGSLNYLQSHIVVGKNTNGPNNIHFNGMVGDSGINNTVLSERIYGGGEESELLLFKGNDTSTGGPDRIRFRSAEHRFQTFTTNEDFSGLSDNNNRLVIVNSGLIGIGTTNPIRQLTINSVNGQNLRLVYNNTTGTEVTYSDITLTSTGKLTFNTVGTLPEFIFTGGEITGVIKTAAQPNITSVGQLTSLSIAGALTAGSFSTSNLGGTLTTAAQPNITSVGALSNLDVTGTLTAGSFSVTDLYATIRTPLQPYITSLGTLTSLNVAGHLTAGSFNVSNLTTTNISGTLTTAAQPNITSVGTLTSLNISGTLTAATFNIGNVSATLDTPEQPNIVSLGTQVFLNISGVTTSTNNTASTSNTTGSVKLAGGIGISNVTDAVSSTNGGTFTSAGGGAFAKSVFVGATLTAANLAGTINTAAQPNITSLGTLTSLTLSGSISGATTIGVTTLNATNISGTISTAAQSNITSLGTIESLRTGTTSVGINTTNPDKQLEINSTTGDCLRLTFNDGTGSAPFHTDFTVASNGILTIKPTGTSVTISANKNLVFSGTGSISGVDTLTATNIAGTITTAAQANITSLGTLTGLTTSGIFNSTLSTASTSSTLGAITLAGGLSISNATNATSNTNGGTFTTAGGGAFAKSLYVGQDLTVAGNLTITGTTTTINSTILEITDNAFLLNNGPSGTNFDSGFMVKRYQDDNDSGLGDIVNSTVGETHIITTATTNTITLPIGASGTNNFYNNWWIKMTNNNAANRVRQIISYNGTSKIATLSSNFDVIPTDNSTVNLYDRSYSNFIWQESNKRFLASYTASSPNSTILTITKNADLAFDKAYPLSTTASTSNSTGAIILVGGIGISNTTDATSSTNGGTITSAGGAAFAKSLFVGLTLTATSLAGTIITASQPNITSLGTLTGLTLSGTISGVTTLTATSLAGTITTVAQPNITSVGTLSVLDVNGITTLGDTTNTNGKLTIFTFNAESSVYIQPSLNNTTGSACDLIISNRLQAISASTRKIIFKTDGKVGFGTSAPTRQLEINSTTGDCLRLTYNDSDGSATNYTDLSVSASGDLTITPSGGDTNIIGTLNVSGNKTLASWLTTGIQYASASATYTNGSIAGTYASAVITSYARPTIAASNAATTTTNAATVYIANSPLAGTNMTLTNSYALWVEAGNTLFGGNVKISVSGNNILACETTSTNVLTNSSFTADFDLYIKKNQTAAGTTSGIAFLQTGNDPSVTTPSASIITTRTVLSSAHMSFNTTQVERFKIADNGICSFLLSTASTSSSVGALLLSGGLSLSNATDATDSTNGGTITTAGGVAIAKKLFVAGVVSLTNTIESTSATTGALVVSGGVGIAKDITLGGTSISLPSWLTSGIQYSSLATTYTNTSTAASGTAVSSVVTSYGRPTIAATNTTVTTTNAATVYIENSPLAGTNMTITNSYSLWIPNGNVLFGGTLSGITTLTATTLVGTISTAAQPNITSLGTLTSLTLSGTISGVTTLTATSLAGTITTAAQPNITSLGTLTGLTLSGTISGVTTLTATSLAGTITTAAQPNITSLGIITNLRTGTGNVGINTSTPDKQLEINSTTGDCLRLTYNDSDGGATIYTDFAVSASGIITITPSGTSLTLAANKNLVLSGTGSISGVSSISATNITGTITTAAQSNITSLGTLTSLKITGTLGVGTTAPDKQLEINSATGDCLRLTYNDSNGTATNYTDLLVSSGGDLTITPSGGDTTINSNITIVKNGLAYRQQSGTGADFFISASGNDEVVVGSFSNHHFHLATNNTNRMTIGTNGFVGIGTIVSNKKLSISDPSGGSMRLIYNNQLGTETIYADYYIDSTGLITFAANGGTSPGFAFTGGNIAGTLSTASQPNITSIGTLSSLTLSGTISGVTTLTATTLAGTLSTAAQTNITSIGTLSTLNMSNAGGTSLSITSTTASSTTHIKYITNGDDWEFGSGGSTNSITPNSMYWYNASVRMVLTNTSRLGINTTAPDKQLEVNSATGDCLRLTYNDGNGSATVYTDFSVSSGGNLTIAPSNSQVIVSGIVQASSGTVSAPSYAFSGDTNTGMYSGGTDILKLVTGGNDIMTILASGNVGIKTTNPNTPLHVVATSTNAIRVEQSTDSTLAANIIYQTNNLAWEAGARGSTATNAPNSFYIFQGSSYRFVINSNGNVGLATTVADKALEINHATGDCLRLTYNDSNGGATNYSDFTVSSGGNLTISPSGSNTTVLGTLTATLNTAAQANVTSLGTLTGLNVNGEAFIGDLTGASGRARFIGTGGVLYLQTSTSNTTNTGSDFFIGNWTTAITASSRKIMFKANGKVGFGTIAPDKELEINSSTGDCLRLTYNDNDGSAANYTDFAVSSGGDLTITPSGNDTTINGNVTVGSLTTSTLNLTGLNTNFASGGLIINSFDDTNMHGRLIKQELITNIDLTDYNPTGQADNYSLEIIGYIQPQYTETYTFHITANEGARLWVNDVLLFNDWVGNVTDTASTTIALTAGKWYNIRIHSYDTTLTQRLLLQWSSTSQTKANISSARMAWDNTENQVNINPVHVSDNLTLYHSTSDTANTVKFEVSSSGELNITPSGGNVGIGISDPITTLDIVRTGTNSEIRMFRTDNSGVALQLKSQEAKARLTYDSSLGYFTIDKDNAETSAMMFLASGLIGINTLAPDKQLEINNSTGNCLRLTYNDNNGTAANYSDFNISATGDLTIAPSGGDTTITGNASVSGSLAATISTAAQPNITSLGTLSTLNLSNTSGNSINITSTSSTSTSHIQYTTNGDDWVFGATGSANIVSANSMYWWNGTTKMVLTNTAMLGINTTVPSKQLEVNSATGDCLRLTYNDADGSAVNYADFTVSSGGNLTIDASSNIINLTSSVFVPYSGSNTAFQVNGGAAENVVFNVSTLGNSIGINTTATSKSLEINDTTGDCLRLTYNDSDGSAVNYADFTVSSGGDLTITPSGSDVRISGKLGINESAPSVDIEVSDTIPEIRLTDSRTDYGSANDVVLGKISFYSRDGSLSGGYGAIAEIATLSTNSTVAPDGRIEFKTGVNGALTTAMTINNQSVGIGLTAPTTKLEINETTATCNLRLKCTTNLLGSYMDINNNEGTILLLGAGGSGTGSAVTDVIIGSSTSSGMDVRTSNLTRMYITSGGFMGIGTTVPDKQLEINSASGNCLRLTYNDGNGSASFYSDLSVSSSGDLTITPSGGDTTITGNVSCTLLEETSDKRVKENITPVDNEDSYNKINKLEIVDYNFISDEQKISHRGIIAQDLLNVIPTAVHIKSGITNGVEDLHTISNKEIMGHLLSAFQHLTKKVEQLEEENKILLNKVNELEKKN